MHDPRDVGPFLLSFCVVCFTLGSWRGSEKSLKWFNNGSRWSLVAYGGISLHRLKYLQYIQCSLVISATGTCFLVKIANMSFWKTQSSARDHTLKYFYITQLLRDVHIYLSPICCILTAVETVSHPLFPPLFVSPLLFLKTIWLQWCVVWHLAHPAALSLLGLGQKQEAVCLHLCMHSNHTSKWFQKSDRQLQREDVCRDSHGEGDVCSASLCQSMQHSLWCVRAWERVEATDAEAFFSFLCLRQDQDY